MKIVVAIVVAVLAAASDVRAAPTTDWTPVIGPLEQYCFETEALESLRNGLYAFARANRQTPARFKPDGWSTAVRVRTIVDNGDHYSAQVMLPGFYAGLPILGMVIEIGKVNGVVGFELYFDTDLETVRATFANVLAAFEAANNDSDNESFATLEAQRTPVGVALVCDEPN